MSSERKDPKANLRKYYTLFLETGLIVVLVIFIVAMKINIHGSSKHKNYSKKQKVVKMKKVKQTQQKKKPPPPPAPQVPVKVPNDQVVKNQNMHFDADLNNNQDLPPPPKHAGKGKKKKKEKIFVAVQQNPKLKGGLAALQKKVNYPASCRNAGISGRVTLQFVVNKKGVPTNVHVIRGIGGGCDKAAVKAVRKYARFKPGRQRGKPVKVRYSLPIFFKLQSR
ncbi:MAG TPA: energy transducer TonB [Balneolaceae bacterium]|nr:energy transducer TonB [Balneolaceae bacterium]